MATSEADRRPVRTERLGTTAWPVAWSGIWVGALTTLWLGLLIGLIGIAVGAHRAGAGRIVRWSEFGLGTLVFSVFGAFLSAAGGAWVTGRIAALRRPETAILHGAVMWVLTVPLLLALVALGAGGFYGEWYAGLAGSPAWARPPATAPADPEAARVARNAALGSLTALLIGLMGAAVGGWMASGEPMRLTFSRAGARDRERAAA